MQFLEKIRAALSRFMSGRYGVDQLNSTLVIATLVLTIVGSLIRLQVLTILGDVLLIVALWRMLSKDRYKRQNENRIYLEKTETVRRTVSEWANRMKNAKQYHYYSCPQCKARYRVPRGVGSITITCKKCGSKFDKKA